MQAELHILLVEDSPADAKIIARALTESLVPHRLSVLSDGRQALDYLARVESPDAPEGHQPDLILLDLNLPGLDGCEVLSQIKSHDTLRSIPVVILTTSRRDEDVRQTYQAGANSYIPKPAEYPHYRDLVKCLHSYWADTSLRPPRIRPRS
jgi:chemotaxis family two-component system response regulator Rcp1